MRHYLYIIPARQVNEEEFIRQSQKTIDRLVKLQKYREAYGGSDVRDLPGDSSRGDDTLPESDGRGSGNPVQS